MESTVQPVLLRISESPDRFENQEACEQCMAHTKQAALTRKECGSFFHTDESPALPFASYLPLGIYNFTDPYREWG